MQLKRKHNETCSKQTDGDTELPKNGQIAREKGWKNVETDPKLITWYNKGGSPVQMAFDKKDVLAGVRLAVRTLPY